MVTMLGAWQQNLVGKKKIMKAETRIMCSLFLLYPQGCLTSASCWENRRWTRGIPENKEVTEACLSSGVKLWNQDIRVERYKNTPRETKQLPGLGDQTVSWLNVLTYLRKTARKGKISVTNARDGHPSSQESYWLVWDLSQGRVIISLPSHYGNNFYQVWRSCGIALLSEISCITDGGTGLWKARTMKHWNF